MNYNDLINTVSAIAENETIIKDGLTLVYELESNLHYKMDEHLFFKSNPTASALEFEHNKEIIIDIGGIHVKLIEKK